MKTEEINGLTKVYAIIGDPISAVRSPAAMNAEFARLGENVVMIAIHVAPADLKTVWAAFTKMKNLDGIIVTMPHKAAICDLVDEIGTNAQVVGAANAVKRCPDGTWAADMFDGIGFVEGMKSQGHTLKGRSIFQSGAGSAGTAVAVALAQESISKLVISDIDKAREQLAVDRIRQAFPALNIKAGLIDEGPFDIAINATALGMKADDLLPFDPSKLPETTLVADVITKPEITTLLQKASLTGHAIHPGTHMHRGQVTALMRYFGFESVR